MESVLRPRDIQARIRAGESPEDVAAAAQTSVEQIMGFATPVLAERAYQAELALKASVRRRVATGHVGQLGEAMHRHLEDLGVGHDAVDWDAWRREDGRWTVVAAYLQGESRRRAEFTYDPAGRYVVAENDVARAIVGEGTPGQAREELPDDPEGLGGSSVPPVEDPAQTQLGDDAIRVVTGGRPPSPPTSASLPQDEVTVDLTETSTAATAAGAGGAMDVGAPDDWMATQASDRSEQAPRETPPAEQEPVSEADVELAPESAGAEQDDEHETLFDVPETEPAKKPAKSRGRASVPTWDEIMFGTPKDD